MATPHYLRDEKTPSLEIGSLSKPELLALNKNLLTRLRDLEGTLAKISRGKYVWEATFDAIADPLMMVRSDYRIERANLGVAKVGGAEITKVPGEKCYEIFAGRKEPCLHCPLQKALTQGELVYEQIGHPIANKDFVAYAHPYYDEGGNLESCVMYYRDVTEELRLRKEVVQQEKMAAIGMLAGGVAHEINNPLGGILAFTQLLLKKTDLKTETVEDLQEIEQAATRCRKIVQELLDFSRVSKEREKCLVQVNTLIEKVLPFVQMEIRSLNIDLQCHLAPKLPQVEAVPNRLQQVFLNLLTNSCHAMPKGGKLLVATRHDTKAKEVTISVQDTGIGMDPKIQERIFEPFFTTKEPGKGTGLGLSISYRIIQEMGGMIDVASAVEKGTTVKVRLPISA